MGWSRCLGVQEPGRGKAHGKVQEHGRAQEPEMRGVWEWEGTAIQGPGIGEGA